MILIKIAGINVKKIIKNKNSITKINEKIKI
jgi:hypothetical protein